MKKVYSYPEASGENWREEISKAGLKGKGTICIESPAGEKAYAVWVDNGLEFGFRNDLHSFPILGGYWEQQLNMLPLEFSLSCWVGGPEMLGRRDALLRVLMSKASSDEPLLLSIPTYQTVPVQFASGNLKESAKRQGSCQFILSFKQVIIAEPKRELVVLSAEAALADASGALEGELAEGLTKGLDASSLLELKKNIEDFGKLMQRGVSKLSLATETLSEVKRKINGISGGIDRLIAYPGNLLQEFTSTIHTLVGAVLGNPAKVERELRRLLTIAKGWGSYSSGAKSRSQQEAAKRSSVLVKGLAAMSVCQVLPDLKTSSREEAEGFYQDLLQIEMSIVHPDAGLMYCLEKQRLALREVLEARGWFALSRVREIDVEQALPSLVLAHKLGISEELLLEMNHSSNAFFLGGRLLYV